MNRVDEYIESYKKLEESVRRVYHLDRDQSVVAELKRQPRFDDIRSEIQSCADLRNYLQHNSRLGEAFAAEPSAEAIAFVQKLTDMVNNRPRSRDICVRKQDVIWRKPEDPVLPAMEIMRAEGHSCIPILRDGRVWGIFDERSLFSAIAGSVAPGLNNLTFRDMAPFVDVNQREMRSYAFSSMNTGVDEIVNLFEQKLEDGKRIRMVLLTFSGKPTDRLQGIITPWDIIANT